MIVTWTIEGVDWSENIKASIDSDTAEIATRGIEQAITSIDKSNKEIQFGAIIRIFHDKMESEDEHFIALTAPVLANAGFHKEAGELKRATEEQFPELR